MGIKKFFYNPPTVNISCGMVKGFDKSNISGYRLFSFYDIPYGQIDARFSNDIQFPDELELVPGPTPEPKAYCRDDCLYIHVHTPNVCVSANLPVIVFIPSEPFCSKDMPSSLLYGPEYLVAEEVVVVIVNYRTGVLANLYFDEEYEDEGSYGSMLDITEALSFIKEDIAYFGGDRDCITAMGHGLGAAYLQRILVQESKNVTRECDKLFHKVIFQSSLSHHIPQEFNLQISARSYLRKLNFHSVNSLSIDEVRAVLTNIPLSMLLEQEEDFYTASTNRVISFDKVAFSFQHFFTMKVKYPIIMGYNSCEGMLEKMLLPRLNYKSKYLGSMFYCANDAHFPQEYLEYWIQRKFFKTQRQTKKEFYNVLSDMQYNLGIIWMATILTYLMFPCPVYLYKFKVDGELNVMKNLYYIDVEGACHGDELGYLFKFPFCRSIRANTIEDYTVTRMVKYWANFAKSDNPNPLYQDNVIFKTYWRNLEIEFRDDHHGQRHYFVTKNRCQIIGPMLKNQATREVRRMSKWKDLLGVDVFYITEHLRAVKNEPVWDQFIEM